jgi:multidrug efflux pump subunit AcrA (membrane-fusion protein)
MIGLSAITSCSSSDSTDVPTANLQPQVITVSREDIRSVVVLDGVIVQNSPVSVPATVAGTVTKVDVTVGTTVQAGAPLVAVQGDTGAPGMVTSPISGVVDTMTVIPQQVVAVGQEVASVAPQGFDAVATVDPSLLYRFYGATPSDIEVQLDQGPAPFSCPFVSLGIPASDIAAGDDPTSQPVQFVCSVPADVQVFSGVQCVIAVTTGLATQALAIPLTAVEGSAGYGYVTVVGPGDQQRTVEVQLGLSNGTEVQVLGGLSEGERILDLPPTLLPAGGAAPAGAGS